MDTVNTLLWFLPSVLFGVGIVITLLAVRRAPAGTESRDGFHYQHAVHRSLESRQQATSDTVPPFGAHLA